MNRHVSPSRRETPEASPSLRSPPRWSGTCTIAAPRTSPLCRARSRFWRKYIILSYRSLTSAFTPKEKGTNPSSTSPALGWLAGAMPDVRSTSMFPVNARVCAAAAPVPLGARPSPTRSLPSGGCADRGYAAGRSRNCA